MSNKWTIKHAGDSPSSPELIDCQIVLDDTAYLFLSPKNDELSRTPAMEPVPFKFPEFFYPAGQTTYKWTVQVNTFTAGRKGDKAEGDWWNNKVSLPAEDSGTWTAQAGAGLEDEEGSEDAAAACA